MQRIQGCQHLAEVPKGATAVTWFRGTLFAAMPNGVLWFDVAAQLWRHVELKEVPESRI